MTMSHRLLRVGSKAVPVVVVDNLTGDAEAVARIADRMAPFPKASTTFYPGVRRVIGVSDGDAVTYVRNACTAATPLIAAAFGIERMRLIEASFSIVTTQPDALLPQQRAPHFDSPDPKYLAMLHYLRVPSGTGTAFFRQRSTGIEFVDHANVRSYVRTAEAAAARQPAGVGYIHGSNDDYEMLESVEAVPDRLLIYQGGLLHSGIIPADLPLSADPAVGRLTANYFLQGQ